MTVTLLVLFAVSGCSSGGEIAGGPQSGSFRDLQFGSAGSSAQAGAALATPSVCPSIDIRPGTATMAFTAATTDRSALGLRYQASVAQTARECTIAGANLTIKVGIQGRVVLGPAGGPGNIEAPLRLALVHDGPSPKTLWTKVYHIPVTIPDGVPSVTFTHIEEAMSVPMPGGNVIESYVIYVGFDPLATRARPTKQPPRKKG